MAGLGGGVGAAAGDARVRLRPFAARRLETFGGRPRPLGCYLIPTLVLLAYLAWPYVTLWRLDRALTQGDTRDLAALVDLDAVRDEIRRKLNKESSSTLDAVSDVFIDWLEQAIRRNGTGALDQQVDLDWVRSRLLSHSAPGTGLLGALSSAYFDHPLHLALRIGAPEASPVYARLTFNGVGWRLTALRF